MLEISCVSCRHAKVITQREETHNIESILWRHWTDLFLFCNVVFYIDIVRFFCCYGHQSHQPIREHCVVMNVYSVMNFTIYSDYD